MASTADIALLRCELARVSMLLQREGGDAVLLPTANVLNQTLVDAAASLGGYILTFWELVVLRGFDNGTFNAAYDAIERYVDNPTAADLDRHVLLFAALFGAAASRRGLADGCGQITFPGLWPADVRTLPQNLPDGDVTQPHPQTSTSKKLSPVLVTSLGAAAISTIILAWALSARH